MGSGFGGSVSALRLAERGYSVAVLECGRRYEDADYAKTTWNWRRFLWMPKLGLRGILRLTLFKDVTILSGCGVGGGSLVYANTLYRPPERFYRDGQWEGMADWEEALEPHYDTAERMLGAAKIPGDDRATRCSGRLLFTLMVGPGSRLGRPLNSAAPSSARRATCSRRWPPGPGPGGR